jgi:hypothetical protein
MSDPDSLRPELFEPSNQFAFEIASELPRSSTPSGEKGVADRLNYQDAQASPDFGKLELSDLRPRRIATTIGPGTESGQVNP